MPDRSEKRSDNWTDKDDRELARLLKEQAEKDRLAQEALKNKEKGKSEPQ